MRAKWTVRELQRQENSSLFFRLAAGKDKDSILQLAQHGQVIDQPSDRLPDPFVFEFPKSRSLQFYLPDREELRREVELTLRDNGKREMENRE